MNADQLNSVVSVAFPGQEKYRKMKDNTSGNQSNDNISIVDDKSKYVYICLNNLLINRETSKCSVIYELHKITIHSKCIA